MTETVVYTAGRCPHCSDVTELSVKQTRRADGRIWIGLATCLRCQNTFELRP